jgi:2-keto-4-pentenoate hydratase/2-oxohepta-3-ene-1,7-dioic acid hydratase in catechol pathway
MRIARFRHAGRTSYGLVEGSDSNATVTPIAGEPFGDLSPSGEAVALGDVQLLAPVEPSKIVGIGLNYDHGAADREGKEPGLFLKPPTAVVAHLDQVRMPAMASGGALYEAELAVVIGQRCRKVAAADYASVVLGYTCANDVSAVGLPPAAAPWPVKSKGFDTFCPLGPWIETELDPRDLAIRCTVNGEVRQDSRTSHMLTAVPELVELASAVMTLLPGDVIVTGTPPAFAPAQVGDDMEVSIEGIGVLRNPIIAD